MISRRILTHFMAAVMMLSSLPIVPAQAALVTTDRVVEAEALADDRTRVMAFMAREDVRAQLEALGIDPAEAARRAESLTEDEIRQIAGRLDEMPAGQDAVGILAVTILVIFLVLLITDLMGVTDVFPFIKKQQR